MNILFCSAGRRCELLKDFKKTMGSCGKVVAADLSNIAPAIYFADKYYLVPRIDDEEYIPTILDICEKEQIDAITTLIDPEIMLLAKNRTKFEEIGVEVLAPYYETAKLCFDKFKMFQYLSERKIPTVRTWGSIKDFNRDLEEKEINFPVFVKPRTGSGSVGARKINDMESLKLAFERDETLIIQEYMECEDLDADVYVDTKSHKPVAIFSKKKLSTKIGGANKTISFKDDKLFDFIMNIIPNFEFNGPIDIDFFYKNGQYYLSEINPRFGGAYLHAYGAGVDFVNLIENNINGIENKPVIGNYEDDIAMLMYDSVVITKLG